MLFFIFFHRRCNRNCVYMYFFAPETVHFNHRGVFDVNRFFSGIFLFYSNLFILKLKFFDSLDFLFVFVLKNIALQVATHSMRNFALARPILILNTGCGLPFLIVLWFYRTSNDSILQTSIRILSNNQSNIILQVL